MSKLPIFDHFLSVGNLKPKLEWFFIQNSSQFFSIELGPRSALTGQPCLASAVITYLDSLRRCLSDISKEFRLEIGMDTALFHRVIKNGYTEQPYGRNRFTKIGQDVASRLGLKCPELYNSNCFRLYSKIEDGVGTPLDVGRKRPMSEQENVWEKIFQGTNGAGKKRPKFSTSSSNGYQ